MSREGIRQVEARELRGAQFRYFDFVMVAMVVVLLLSNVIGAEKRSFTFDSSSTTTKIGRAHV